MNGYLIRVWCRDCCYQDQYGCFGGDTELRGRDGWDAAEPFATVAEAEAAGYKLTNGPPWDFEVTDSAGTSVQASQDK